MYTNIKAACSVVLALTLGACAGSSTNTDLTPSPTEATLENMPAWYSSPPADSNYLFGLATATSRDLQLAVDKAKAAGRNDIAQQLNLRFSSLAKRFQEEVGIEEDSELLDQFTQAYKAVTDEVLVGTRARQQDVQAEGSVYRAYVLMDMPVGAASEALLARLRAREQAYTRFRSTQVFEELEQEVAKYQEWKREQGIP